jgi:protein TonB
MSSEQHRREHLRRRIVFWSVMALAAGVIGLIAWQMAHQTKSTKKQNVQQITMVKPLPPPPPPPPPKEKPPEVKKEEVKIEEKIEQPKDAPPQQAERALGIDADAAAGSDGFGLAANRGGRDITTIGGDGGASADSRLRHGYYFGLIKRHVDEIAQRNRELQGRNYQVAVGIWLDRTGGVQRYELIGSSGDEKIDRALRETLAGLPPLREPPPQDMPQPVVLRLSSRGA